MKLMNYISVFNLQKATRNKISISNSFVSSVCQFSFLCKAACNSLRNKVSTKRVDKTAAGLTVTPTPTKRWQGLEFIRTV